MSASPISVIDTSVWIDSFCADHIDHDSAKDFIDHATAKHLQLMFAIHSATDVLYILNQEFKRVAREEGRLDERTAHAAHDTALACMRNMCQIATPVGADASDLWLADKYLRLHDDFEDDLVLAACKRAGADYLVTTDRRLLQHADVAAKTPAQMVQILELLA